VLDISMTVKGAPAMHAHSFLDVQWKYICAETRDGYFHGRWGAQYPVSTPITYCPPIPFVPEATNHSKASTGVPAFTAGRLGSIGNSTSDLAIAAMFDTAVSSIKLAVQDMGPILDAGPIHVPYNWYAFGHHWVMVSLAKALVRGVRVEIVQSELKAMDAYGVGWSPQDVASMAMWYLAHASDYGIPHQLNSTQIKSLVCRNFSVSTVHYIANETGFAESARCPALWLPEGSKPYDCNSQGASSQGGHAKYWAVDDTAFYIGSQNLYPNNLAEWGMIVDDVPTTLSTLKQFWDPLWAASAPFAPTGTENSFETCLATVEIPRFPLLL